MKYLLSIDSSGRTAGVCLFAGAEPLVQMQLDKGLTHSETLLELVDLCLKEAGVAPKELDFFGVSAGPGSFTGLRIGCALVKGMALPFGTPVAAVSTLRATALSVAGDGVVLAAQNARRGEVYWAAFEGKDARRLTPDAAAPASAARDFARECHSPVVFVGDGAQLCYTINDCGPDRYILGDEKPPIARGVALAALAMEREGRLIPAAALRPEYLRLSQAERERQKA